MHGDKAGQGLFSEGLRSQTAFVLSAAARHGAGKAGTTATDPGSVGGKQKRRGMRKPSCCCSAAAPSSQGSLILCSSGTDFFSATLAPAAKPGCHLLDNTNSSSPFLPVPGIICTRDRENREESSEENCSSKERHGTGKGKSSPLATPNKHRRTCQQFRTAVTAPCHGGAGKQLWAFPWSQHQQVQP